jgi:dihydroorotase
MAEMAAEPFDLVVTGGRVIDPAQGIDQYLDVAIAGDRIAALGKDLVRQPAKHVVAANGAIVCPGLIDIHVHVYEWVTNFGVWADDAGVNAGATTIVDQGSSGAWTYGGFKAHVIDKAVTDVRAFVSINLAGALKGGMEAERLHNPGMVDVAELVALAAANPCHIRGFKCHAESGALSHWGLEVFKQAVRAGELAGLPLYVHTGELFPVKAASRPEPRAVIEAIRDLLKPGDMLAHIYSAMPDGIVGRGAIPPIVFELAKRGILFDIGYGINFSYAIARRMMAEGLYPHTIGSDVHGDFESYHDEAKLDYSLCGAMTRLLALGMPLERVIAATTCNPAGVIGETANIGALKPGMKANVSLLDMVAGAWTLSDGQGEKLTVANRLVPALVVMAGKVIEPSRRLLRDIWPPQVSAAAE